MQVVILIPYINYIAYFKILFIIIKGIYIYKIFNSTNISFIESTYTF